MELVFQESDGLWDFGRLRYDFAPAPVPEPATVLLVSAGLLALGGVRRKGLLARTDRRRLKPL